MAPKGGNAKKEAGRARKAENEAKKQQQAQAEKERKEAARWDEGAKGKSAKEDKEAKRLQALAAKAERERLLAEEEAAAPSKPKATPKVAAKKKQAAARPAGPGAIAAGGGLGGVDVEKGPPAPQEYESFSASNIDDAIEMLQVVNAKKDKASVGQAAAGLEKHPERRFKAAFEAYQERELPNLKKDRPGLRLNQYKELLFKQFQKSPENPFNQSVVAYDATKEERVEALEKRNKEIEERLKDRTKSLTLDD